MCWAEIKWLLDSESCRWMCHCLIYPRLSTTPCFHAMFVFLFFLTSSPGIKLNICIKKKSKLSHGRSMMKKRLFCDKDLLKMKMICKVHVRFIPVIRTGKLSNISSFILTAKYRIYNPANSQTHLIYFQGNMHMIIYTYVYKTFKLCQIFDIKYTFVQMLYHLLE